MPSSVRNSAGPIWSKKMNGPTICRRAAGSAPPYLEGADIPRPRDQHRLDGIAFRR